MAHEYCGECPHKQTRTRQDFYPPTEEYWCLLTGEWIGFIDRVPKSCPITQDKNQCET